MLKQFVAFLIILGLVLGAYYGGLIGLFTLRIISYVLIFFGAAFTVLMATILEAGGLEWLIRLGTFLLITGLVLAFLPV